MSKGRYCIVYYQKPRYDSEVEHLLHKLSVQTYVDIFFFLNYNLKFSLRVGALSSVQDSVHRSVHIL